MNKSYPKAGAPVNKQAQTSDTSTGRPSAPDAQAYHRPRFNRSASRDTATFVPYYWEAYNEIAEPRRFDHYLVNRWMPDLGPLGFCIVKALRDKCYHNPESGILRDQCDLKMVDLAEQLKVSRATLFREFERNEALSHFVKREEQVQRLGGKLVQAENTFKVCMDDPIHWDDMERYELLRAERELARMQQPQEISGRRIKGEPYSPKTPQKSESQIETLTPSNPASESQIETAGVSQIETPLVSQIETAIKEDLPSEILTKDSLTPSAPMRERIGTPLINPPKGKERDADLAPAFDPLQSSWNVALELLKEIVNTATLNAHLKPMRLVSVEGDVATLAAPTAFAKTWIEGRHRAEVEAALAEALGQAVTVQITTGGK